ncbi:MAG TPA: tetratricopeptide repeat protein [Acidobacteriota bacterium]|nr:tetratricopeptide repeat protein [Acidobacteriota bacterium]HQG90054.1 tetratricopeptide repeat protein [Acidobacteriota bacterium]HQK87151.1 tetratricopeptide repeat protein [Acidobacteriota bacterium]
MARYYFQIGNDVVGPLDAEGARAAVREGRVRPDTPARLSPDALWEPAGRLLADWPGGLDGPGWPPGPSGSDATLRTPGTVADTHPSGVGRAFRMSLFGPGELVAERYRVLRFIGRGGMGEVYEVEDTELHERVALKTIRPEIAGDENAVNRFKREIHLARKVTHPNVCRIFDLGIHHWLPEAGGKETGGEEPGVFFLTMELIPGETLAERLNRVGRLEPAAALPLVEQICAALDAAHQAGIVHRDFKTGNVMLIPAREGAAGERAVITDFGMARSSVDSDSPLDALTVTGQISGTPTFMAPEQVEGGPVTAAADIYALGVVLYRTVTGTWPFVADTPLATALKRLREAPVPPSAHLPGLDPKWEAAILRCLQREPAARFPDARSVAAALRGETADGGPRTIRLAPRRPVRRWLVVVVPALALAVTGIVLWRSGVLTPASPVQSSGQSAVAMRRAVAVLGFKNLSGRPDADWLATALAEMIRTELGPASQLRLIPGENIARMRLELALPEADTLAPDTLQRIRRNLGTDVVVLGSYLALGERGGDRIRLDVRVQDTVSGETLATLGETGQEAEVFDLVARLGGRLRAELGGAATTGAKAAPAVRPADAKVLRLYAEGLARLQVFDAQTARDRLLEATRLDPAYPPAWEALAASWTALGHDAEARAASAKAFALSRTLDRETRLRIEARYHEAQRQWAQAVEIYRSLWIFYPDNLEYGLRLASAQVAVGQGADALATVAQLRKLPAPAGDDPRVDLAEASAAGSQSDYRRQAAAAGRAADKGRTAETRSLTARALLLQSGAYREMGELKPAQAAATAAQDIFAALGDRGGQAQALRALANIRYDQGDHAAAKRDLTESLRLSRAIGSRMGEASALGNLAVIYKVSGDLTGALKLQREALAILEELGETEGMATIRNNIANIYYIQGDYERARLMFEQARQAFAATGNRSGVALIQNNLATILFDLGRLEEAGALYRESLAIRKEIGDKPGQMMALANLGEVERLRGNLPEARRLYRQSLELARTNGVRSLEAWALFGQGELEAAAGDLAAARRLHEQALAIRTEINEAAELPLSHLALAGVALREGRAAEARALAEQALAAFQQSDVADGALSARLMLAAVALEHGQADSAVRELAAARTIAAQIQYAVLKLRLDLMEARALIVAGPAARATERLQRVLAECRRLGLMELELEVRLWLARAELAAGRRDVGRAGLETLRRDAATRGFGWLARQAATP